jgi:NADPH:quinone reductase-like Zn-dependent oxidoreductase
VVVGGEGAGKWFGIARPLQALALSLFVRQRLRSFVSRKRQEDLETLRGLLEEGKIMPAIDRTFPLSEAPEAIGYLREGRARGKVVIVVVPTPG